MHIGIARLLGVELYGVFGIIMSFYLVNDALLNIAIPRTISKFMSDVTINIRSLMKISLRMQFALTFFFSALYLIFAHSIADLLGDSSLSPYLIFLGFMLIPYSWLSLMLSGYMNGLRQFRLQAIIKTSLLIVRVVLAFLFMFLGYGIFGVLWAFLLSYLYGLLVTNYFLSREKKVITGSGGSPVNFRKIFLFAFPLTVAIFSKSLIRNVNTLFIKYFLVDNAVAGLYTAAFTVSNLSYLVFSALPMTLTPSVSKAFSEENGPLIRKYLSSSLRYCLLILAPFNAVAAATAPQILSLIYSPSYVSAAPVLAVLVFGSTFLVFFSVLLSVTTACGKPKIELNFTILLLVILVFLDFLLMPSYGLVGAAYAQLITSIFACAVAAAYVYARFKTLTNLMSSLKIILVSVFIYLIASLWQYSGLMILFNYLVYGLIYFLILYLFGEISTKDFQPLKKLFKK